MCKLILSLDIAYRQNWILMVCYAKELHKGVTQPSHSAASMFVRSVKMTCRPLTWDTIFFDEITGACRDALFTAELHFVHDVSPFQFLLHGCGSYTVTYFLFQTLRLFLSGVLFILFGTPVLVEKKWFWYFLCSLFRVVCCTITVPGPNIL